MKKSYILFSIFIITLFKISPVSAQVSNIYISEIMYDSPLQEDKFNSPAEHNNGEYIKLYNPTNQTINISGWIMKGTEQWEQFIFPAGTTIQAQGILLVAYISNSSFNFAAFYNLSGAIKVINQSAIILYNKGEMVSLYDASANLVDAIGYGYMAAASNTSVLYAHNGTGKSYNQLMSLHRTQVSYNNGLVTSKGNADMTYALATPSAGGNAYVNNTTPLIPPAAPPIDLNQMTSQNYIITSVPLVAKTTSVLGARDELTTIQYFDGLGRPVETVERAITPGSKDLVTLTQYDGAGREYRHWLPITGNGSGVYLDSTAFTNNTTALYGGDAKPYAESLFESSPLNRVLGQCQPGAVWNVNHTKIDYQTNISTDQIACFFVNNSNQLERNGNYNPSTLSKTMVTDEDGKIVVEYKDLQGQVVMKRSSSNVDTYYVYNDLDQLCYVLPPNASDLLIALTGNVDYIFTDNNIPAIKQFAYLYQYDERGNNVVKRLPGCDYVYMVYDQADRLVMSQDGNKRLNNNWIVNKYDAFGRVIYTGLENNSSSRVQLKAIYDFKVITENYILNTGYTCNNFCDATPLTINYYDNYDFCTFVTNGSNLSWGNQPTGYDPQYGSAKGLLTGTQTYILDKTINSYLTTTMYYDDHERVVQTRAGNQLGGYDITYNHYDFTGKVLTTRKEHNISGQAVIPEVYSYTYDQAERLINTSYELNNKSSVMLSGKSYDELGRLTTNNRHNQLDLQSYAYNIRNWTTMIKSGGSEFEEDLYYNNNLPTGTTACFNGNISYSTWTYNGVKKGYSYNYDDLNRLLSATSKQETSTQGDGYFNENFTYDKQGNILTLQRKKDNVFIDDLTLHYSNNEKSNQLEWIDDREVSLGLSTVKQYQNKSTATSGEFAHDANGNMIKDLDRNIGAIQYNILNLPDIIQFKNGNQIKNTYDADGHKLGTEYFTQLTNLSPLADGQIISQSYIPGIVNQDGTAYIGTFEYNTLNGNAAQTTLSRIYNDEGYVENIASPNYYYYRRDHLGDNREVWCANTNTTVQRTQYYPSGLPWASNDGDNPGKQQRKYNGKEFVEMHGYDTYDIVWRQYYPAIMRFQTMDPLIEDTYNLSPYTMCSDNMVNRIDPDGRWDKEAFSKTMSSALPLAAATVIIGGGPEEPVGDAVAGVEYIGFLATAVFIAATTPQRTAALKSLSSSTNSSSSSNSQASTSSNQAKANTKTNNAPATAAAPAPKNQNDKKRNNSSSEQTTKQEKIRKSEGADGSTSKHIIEKDANGKTISKTHQVTNTDGEVIHQHQEHVSQTPAEGQKPTMRRFPDDWIEHKSVNAK